jgi:hypothetical protein
MITELKRQNQKQIAMEQPLVSARHELTILLDEYLEHDLVYRNKINVKTALKYRNFKMRN